MTKATVVIDPGHGGTTEIGGSSSNNAISFSGVLEKAMALQMGMLVRQELQSLNDADNEIKVVLTRDTDVNLGLAERGKGRQEPQRRPVPQHSLQRFQQDCTWSGDADSVPSGRQYQPRGG